MKLSSLVWRGAAAIALLLPAPGRAQAPDASTSLEATTAAEPAAVPRPRPDPSPSEQNVFYGAVAPLAENGPVIVFVHGLRGTASDWWIRNDMVDAAFAGGYRTAYLSLNADNSRNDASIEANAAVLKALLPRIAARFGVSRLYVIAHSKGGLDMQAAILDPAVARLVKALIMISTPNQGTELADWAFGPGRPLAGALNLLTPAVEAMKTTTMALFRSITDPALKASGIPFYTIAGDRFIGDPLTVPTGLLLRELVPDQENDGFVTVARARLSADFAVDLGEVPWDHYRTLTGKAAFARIHAVIQGQETMLAGFRRVAANGFNEFGGSSSNAWAWTMKWFKGRLYVGTGREVLCTTLLANDVQTGSNTYPLAVLDELCAPIEEYPSRLAAEIWEYTPGTEEWRRVFRSPATVLVGVNEDGSPRFTARDVGFRGMTTFTEPDGTEALYVGGVTSGAVFGYFPPYDTTGFPPPRLLRTTDGENWRAVPQRPGTFLGEIGKPLPGGTRKIVSFRALTPYKGKLFATVSDYRGVGQVIASANPAAGNNAWFQAAPVLEQFPAWNLHVFSDQLYVTTGDSFISKEGYGVYRTDAAGTPPYTYTPVVTNGAWQANPTFRSTQGLSFMEFKGQLYAGTNRPTELIRINPDDSWDLIVGEPRVTPSGLKMPLSGLGIGFGSWFNGHFWRMGVHGDQLYLGTWDWSVGLKGFAELDKLFGFQYGFDLYRTDDGIHWSAVTRTGMGDGHNYGGRSFESTPFGLFFGTARQRGGLQVFQGPFEPDTPPAIAPPRRLEAVSEVLSGRTAILRWDDVPGAVRYRVYRATVKSLRDVISPESSLAPAGSALRSAIDDIRAGRFDAWCPAALADTAACAAIMGVKTAAAAAPATLASFPMPWELVGAPVGTTFSEPAPTGLQSLYFVRAEDAQGNLSEPSNFVGGPSKAPPFAPPPAPPRVTAVLSPPPNAEGWNRTDVDVTWQIATPGSGLAQSAGCEPVTVTAEGSTRLECSVTNSHGATASGAVTVNIDRTPPALVGVVQPAPNAAGWNKVDSTVRFDALDGGSGVATLSGPVALTGEGAGLVASGAATDRAGNVAAASVVVNIDRAPPAALLRFDPATRDLLVFARDELSGAPAEPIPPAAPAAVAWRSPVVRAAAALGGPSETRAYRIEDHAGNTLVLSARIARAGQELHAQVDSVQYDAQPPAALPGNAVELRWTLGEDGAFVSLQQRYTLGPRAARRTLTADFDAATGLTRVQRGRRESETRPGLYLATIVLAGHRLRFEAEELELAVA